MSAIDAWVVHGMHLLPTHGEKSGRLPIPNDDVCTGSPHVLPVVPIAAYHGKCWLPVALAENRTLQNRRPTVWALGLEFRIVLGASSAASLSSSSPTHQSRGATGVTGANAVVGMAGTPACVKATRNSQGRNCKRGPSCHVVRCTNLAMNCSKGILYQC
jgi:hypothetical protein